MVELKINIGDEYKIKIEKGKDFKGSIFNNIYEKAALNIDEIINQAEIKRDKIKTSYISDFSISDDYNNIITFTGERGSGKSSSMVSFGEALVNKNNSENVGGFFKDYINIDKKEFLSIEMIDPSLFGSKDTLLEIIISKMFLKFQKHLENNNNSDLDYDKKRQLIVLFQKVFENLKTLHNEKKIIYEQEAIEALSKLANGTNLKENFKLLIDYYLDYFKKHEGFLLIAIDDFDLNINGAYFMLEEIRQFLIQSNIIILLACKIEQLHDSVKQSIINDYKELLNYGKEKISDSPDSKSIKYLDKLFPVAHRLSIPKFNTQFLNENLEKSIDEKHFPRKPHNYFIVKDKKGHEVINSESIEIGLLKYIYEKYTFFITKSKTPITSIFPNTLRELSNFIGFLNINEEVNDLKGYFLIEIKNNLNLKYWSLFYELESVEISFINQYIINWIGKNHPVLIKFKEEDDFLNTIGYQERIGKTNYHTKYRDYENLINALNNKNCSFSDILALLIEIEKNSQIIDNENNKFIFYLKVYYSLRYKMSLNQNESSVYEITCTSLINNHINLIPNQRSNGKERDIFTIYQFNILLDKVKNNEIKIDTYYWLCFFINNLGQIGRKYRDEDEIFYRTPINRSGSQFKEARFNWLSFLVNSLEPDLIKKRLLPENLWDQNIDLYNDLISWNNNLNGEYFQLFNIMFFDELVNIWSDHNFNFKESLGDNYGEAMNVYFSKNAFKHIFDALKEKYPYLKINENILEENPIIQFWRNNPEEIKNILNEVFNTEKDGEQTHFKSLKITQKQTDLINNYINNIPRRKNKKSTTTNLINNLIDSKLDESIISSIQRLRNSMNLKKDHNKIVDEILIILKNI